MAKDNAAPQPESSTAAPRCLVCGGLYCGPEVHGLYKTQLAESAGEVVLSFDPIVMHGRTVGYCFLATIGGTQIDSVLIGGDCDIEAA